MSSGRRGGYVRRPKAKDDKIAMQIIVPRGGFLNVEKFKKAFPYMMNKVREDALDFWRSEASRRLNSSRHAYINAIDSKATSKDNFSLFLNNEFATSIEVGWGEFDMKPGYNKSDKMKDGPVNMPMTGRKRKIPADKRAEMAVPKGSYRWMIIPIGKPGNIKFRTYTTLQTGWINSGYQGAKILDDVKDKIVNELLEKHIDEMLQEWLK